MRPACIQILFPHGTGAVERLGTNIGKKKKKLYFGARIGRHKTFLHSNKLLFHCEQIRLKILWQVGLSMWYNAVVLRS